MGAPTKRLAWGLLLLAGMAVSLKAAPGDWIRPVASTDVLNLWTTDANAYDGSLATYASDASNRVGYGGEMQFTLPATLLSDRVRVSADFGYGVVDKVQIKILPHLGAWTVVYDGVINDVSYSELTFTQQQIDAFSFTFHYLSTGYNFWLYDIAAMEASPAPTAPVVLSTSATSLSDNAAVLHAILSNSGGLPCQLRFEYGLTAAYGSSTPWQSGYGTGDTMGYPIGGLAAATLYHFRAEAQQFSTGPFTSGADLTFVTGPIPDDGTAGFVTPIVRSDATGRWLTPERSREDDDNSFATCYHTINSGQPWSPYLYMQMPAVWANGVRMVAPSTALQDQIAVDISSGGVWQNIYTGVISGALTVGFSTAHVTQARVMVRTTSDPSGFYWQLNEFDFRASTTPPPSTILNLAAASGFLPGTSTLTWTAPGNYGSKTGTTSKQYDIRYSTIPANAPSLSNALFSAAASVSAFGTIPTPSVKGTAETMSLAGLIQGTTYYYAIKARNEIPLWSLLSNGANAVATIPTRGISISTTSYVFGSVPLGTSVVSTAAVQVTNSGNVISTFTFSAATTTLGSPWTLSPAEPTAPDQVVIYGAFHATQPASGTFGPEDVILTTAQVCNATRFSINGTQTGTAVPVSASRPLWIKVAMPTKSSTAQSQNVTITLTAGP